MSRVEVPGGWAELRSPGKVHERARRRYIAAMTDLSGATADLPRDPNDPTSPDPAHMNGTHMALADRVSDMLILCLVREWSFGEVTEDVIGELETDQFDPIFKQCRDVARELMPDYSPDIDPKAPTGGSQPSPVASSTDALISATPASDGIS